MRGRQQRGFEVWGGGLRGAHVELLAELLALVGAKVGGGGVDVEVGLESAHEEADAVAVVVHAEHPEDRDLVVLCVLTDVVDVEALEDCT